MTDLLASRAQQAEDKHRQQQLLKFQQDDMIRDQLVYAQRAEEREVRGVIGFDLFSVCLWFVVFDCFVVFLVR